jgi:hypothetical protein
MEIESHTVFPLPQFSLIFKPQAGNPDCTGVKLGGWVQCPPIELTPFIVAEGIARIGGRWAGFEAAVSLEINVALRFGPFRFAALTVPFKFEAKVWLGFLRKSYAFQRTFCLVGNACGKRAGEIDEVSVVPGAEIPLKPSNPGFFIETVAASANEYIRLEDYADTISLAAVAIDRVTKDFAMAVWTSRAVSDIRPSNYRLNFVNIVSNDETADGVSFSEPEVIAELFNPDFSDTNPAISWMPNSESEFLLVWTRVENASFVNTAPQTANGSIMLTDDESAALLRQTSVMWATFKPGYGWTERGRITDDPSTLTSGAVTSRSDTFHQVYQPIIVAYESSMVAVNETAHDIQLMQSKIFVSKFESSALEMSAPVSLADLSTSPTRMSVASWGQIHNLAYEINEFNGTEDVPRVYFKTFVWNLTSSIEPTMNMAVAPSSGIVTPQCGLGSIGSIVNFAWARNLTSESLDASDARFVLAWTCGTQLWAGVIDPSSSQPAIFEVVVDNAGDSPILTVAHNDTHVTLTRWARELRTSSSAYYMQTFSLSSFPPTTQLIKNTPSTRHARPTAQEDDIWSGYFQNDLLIVTSKDNLFNQKLAERNTTNVTTNVVKRRLVAAVFSSSQKSDVLLSVVCTNASYTLGDAQSYETVVSVSCHSNIPANITFTVLTGEHGEEENIMVGSAQQSVPEGEFTVRIPVITELLSGGFLVIDADAPAFDNLRIDGPPSETELKVVPGSVEQLSADPAVIQLDIRNFGTVAPDAVVIAVYLESAGQKRILVGLYEEDEMLPALGDQFTFEIPLWGIDSPGVFELSISVYDHFEATYPADYFRYTVEFRRTAAITLLPHDLVPLSGSVRVSIPAGRFFPTVVSLIDVDTEQLVDEVILEDFAEARNITLQKDSAKGQLVVCASLVSLEETPEQLLENGLCTPVPYRQLPRLTTSFNFLGISAADVREASAGSHLYYVVYPPRLASPWGVMIRASGLSSTPSLAVSSTFLDASQNDAGGLPIYRQSPLRASAAFSSFGERTAVDSSALYASVYSASADQVSTELVMVQFIDIDDGEPLLCDASAPVLFSMKPGRSGSGTLVASRDMAGARMYLSSTGYAFSEGDGTTSVAGVLQSFNRTIEIPFAFDNGTTFTENQLEGVVSTTWTLANLVSGQAYFVTLVAGDSASAPFFLSANIASLKPQKLSSCPIQISSPESVPMIKATTLPSGQIEVEISIRDETTNAKNDSRLDDVNVNFGRLPQCTWRLKDPLMLASWTQTKSVEGASCGRRIFSKVFDSSEVGACFGSSKRALNTGQVTVIRSYRTAGSSQPQLAVTVSNVTVDQSPAPIFRSTPTGAVTAQPVGAADSFTDRPGFVGGVVFLAIVVAILIVVVVILILRLQKSPAASTEVPMVTTSKSAEARREDSRPIKATKKEVEASDTGSSPEQSSSSSEQSADSSEPESAEQSKSADQSDSESSSEESS